MSDRQRPTDPEQPYDPAAAREHRQGWLLLAAIFGGLALLVVLAAMV